MNLYLFSKDDSEQVSFLDNGKGRGMSPAPPTFTEHVIIPTHSALLGCRQNNSGETGMGWNLLLCSGASLAVVISPGCDKPACPCTVTVSKQEGNNVVPHGLHTSRPVLKQAAMPEVTMPPPTFLKVLSDSRNGKQHESVQAAVEEV